MGEASWAFIAGDLRGVERRMLVQGSERDCVGEAMGNCLLNRMGVLKRC